MAYNKRDGMPEEQDIITKHLENKLVSQQDIPKLKVSTMITYVVNKNAQIFRQFYEKNKASLATQLAVEIRDIKQKI